MVSIEWGIEKKKKTKETNKKPHQIKNGWNFYYHFWKGKEFTRQDNAAHLTTNEGIWDVPQ